ncbi:ATP-dependent DNA ligase [uncultured archaeon]|nr:ATP-dependent DNA ligase [uncultured archaeon]
MQFNFVSQKFNELDKTTKRLEMTAILKELFLEADEDLKMLVYLILGKVAPDFEGIEFGMGNKLIINALSSVSGKSEKEISGMFARTGDVGSVARDITAVKKQKSLASEELTVKYVFNSLRKLADTSGAGSVKEKESIYSDLILNGTPDDAMYITRVIAGKLRLGVSDATVLDALVEAFYEKTDKSSVETAYNFHPDLGYIAELLRDRKIDQIKKIGPEPLIPFKVMLAERLPDIDQILGKMSGEKAAFEFKYDGLRAGIHKLGDRVRIFSRGNEDTTSQFPDIVENLKKTFRAESVILDGEAVPYNPETGELYPFQMVSQRRGRKYDLDEMKETVPVVVFLFDILYLNGESLVSKPYLERRRTLESLFEENDSFKMARSVVSDDPGEIEKFFEDSIEHGCEGVVAKNVGPESVYRAGSRGWLWIKFKRDYQAELWDALDLVVVGAFHGHGRRKGTYGALLMASYNKEKDVFETVCKLGTGFTDEVLFSLPDKFSGLAQDRKPPNLECELEPDVWIYPEKVMEIVGAEITLSPVHTCAFSMVKEGSGLALRFPRFNGRWRDDKSPTDATTTNEVLEMYKNQSSKNK